MSLSSSKAANGGDSKSGSDSWAAKKIVPLTSSKSKSNVLEDFAEEEAEEEATAPSNVRQAQSLEEKWTSIRAQALSFLNARKIAYDILNQKKKERIRELTLHIAFLVLFSWGEFGMVQWREMIFFSSCSFCQRYC